MEYVVKYSGELQYLLTFPKDFDPAKKVPVIFYLHGSGTRGKAPEEVLETDVFTQTGKLERFPFLMVTPICPSNETWFDWLHQLKILVKEIVTLPYADMERFYGMGTSMGGYGIWQLAMAIPETFAAILPLCGGGIYWNAKRLVNVPAWAFHGAQDKTVLPEESVKMVEKINKLGGNAKLTIYPDNAHNVWTDTYSRQDVFDWLLEHTNKNEKDTSTELTDAKIYG